MTWRLLPTCVPYADADADDDAARIGEDRIVARGLGGRVRTIDVFRAMAHEVGLEVAAATRQASGRFVVECRPRR